MTWAQYVQDYPVFWQEFFKGLGTVRARLAGDVLGTVRVRLAGDGLGTVRARLAWLFNKRKIKVIKISN